MVGEQTVHPIKNGLYTFSSMVTEPDEDDGTRGLTVTLRYPNTLEKADIKRIKTHKSVWTKVWIWASSLTCQLSATVYIDKENETVWNKEWISLF